MFYSVGKDSSFTTWRSVVRLANRARNYCWWIREEKQQRWTYPIYFPQSNGWSLGCFPHVHTRPNVWVQFSFGSCTQWSAWTWFKFYHPAVKTKIKTSRVGHPRTTYLAKFDMGNEKRTHRSSRSKTSSGSEDWRPRIKRGRLCSLGTQWYGKHLGI